MRSIGRLAVLALFLTLWTTNASAQTVRGRVVDESSRRPIAGATVRLLSSGDREVAVTMTDRSGEWEFQSVATASSYRIRVERVGYARIETAPFIPGSGIASMELATKQEVVTLEGVSVRDLNYAGLLGRAETRKSAVTLLPDEVAERMRRKQPRTAGRLIWGTIANLTLSGFGKSPIDWPYLPASSLYGSQRGRQCAAVLVVDGVPHFHRLYGPEVEDFLDLSKVRAVEVYDDAYFIPLELTSGRRVVDDEGSARQLTEGIDLGGSGAGEGPDEAALWADARCGAIFFWTAEGLGIP